MKMKVIKNGVEEERDVDYFSYDDNWPSNLKKIEIPRCYPVLLDNEECRFTICGKCYIYEESEC